MSTFGTVKKKIIGYYLFCVSLNKQFAGNTKYFNQIVSDVGRHLNTYYGPFFNYLFILVAHTENNLPNCK